MLHFSAPLVAADADGARLALELVVDAGAAGRNASAAFIGGAAKVVCLPTPSPAHPRNRSAAGDRGAGQGRGARAPMPPKKGAGVVVEGPMGKVIGDLKNVCKALNMTCLLYTSPSPRDRTRSRMPSSA